VSLPPFAEALSIGEAPHHFESHPWQCWGLTRVPMAPDDAATMTETLTQAPALAALTPSERILLFCVASGTGAPKTRTIRRTIEGLTTKGLIKREPDRLVLTEVGRATLNALLSIS
jgi:hypothetical protein